MLVRLGASHASQRVDDVDPRRSSCFDGWSSARKRRHVATSAWSQARRSADMSGASSSMTMGGALTRVTRTRGTDVKVRELPRARKPIDRPRADAQQIGEFGAGEDGGRGHAAPSRS